MASRASLNKVLLIGNLTRDPELRYTPQGNAVCTFGVATNRTWQPADGGERREETEFHRIVAWNKLAELCSQLLTKGRKIYCEGRLQTRQWQTPDGQQKQITEVVIDDMRLLDSRRPGTEVDDIVSDIMVEEPAKVAEPVIAEGQVAAETKAEDSDDAADKKADKKTKEKKSKEEKEEEKSSPDDDDILSDLPF
jgi:single-strand DNA-binding protein